MNVMMLAASQNQALNVPTSSRGEGVSSTGKFGDILSQTLKPSVQSSNEDNGLSGEQLDDLKSLLDFLKLEGISDIENGEELANEALINSDALHSLPLLKDILGDDAQEDLLASLLGLNGETTNKEITAEELMESLGSQGVMELNQDMIQQLGTFVEKLLGEMNNPASVNDAMMNASNVLKFGKIYTLLKNNMDLSTKQIEQLEALKNSLDKVVLKLDQILRSSIKSNDGSTGLLNRQASFETQLQNMNTRNITGQRIGLQNQKQTTSILGNDHTVTHNPFLSMSKVEQFVLTIPTNKAPINQEEFMKAFENLLSKAKFSNSNGMQKLFIKLNPESLGSLRIELIQKDGLMMAKIIASTKGAKELLDSQLQGLKQSFVNQNIAVDRIEVSQAFSNQSNERNLYREQSQNQNNNSEQNQQSNDDANDVEDFQGQFEEALLQADIRGE